MPVRINSPYPPAPMNAPSVAKPTFITADVLMPARIVRDAIGNSTSRNRAHAESPSASADSRMGASATGLGGIGVRLDGNASVTNTGVIEGGDGTGAGVRINTSLDTFFTNSEGGSVSAASGLAIQGGAGRSAITNSGTLAGDVLLGSNDDVFNWGTGSTVTGVVDGEGGTDDILRLFQTDPSNPVVCARRNVAT